MPADDNEHQMIDDVSTERISTGARNQISHMPLTTHGASFVYNIVIL